MSKGKIHHSAVQIKLRVFKLRTIRWMRAVGLLECQWPSVVR